MIFPSKTDGGFPMKTFLLIALTILSLPVLASENRSCEAMIEELGISSEPNTDGSMRRIRFEGTSDKGVRCVLDFMPDFCTFEVGSPLKTPDMNYLMSTDDSSVSIKFKRGENFYIQAVTKESTVLKTYKKTFNLKKYENGYKLEFRKQEGRFFKDELEKFSCSIKRT